MLNLIETDEVDTANLNELESDLKAAVLENSRQNGDEQKESRKVRTVEVDDEKLPQRMRGKSVEDIIEMYRNLEAEKGRMANDLGVQRKLTDRLLDLKRDSDLQNNSARPKVEVGSTELLENPTAAIEKILESRDANKKDEYAGRLQKLESQIAAKAFIEKHTDFRTVADDPEFRSWIEASPYRQKVAQAGINGDWQATDELVSTYKEVRQARAVKTNRNEEATGKNKSDLDAARNASFERGSGSDNRKGGNSGKIYSRAALLKLQIENPDAYYDEDTQAELLKAYAEKRVR